MAALTEMRNIGKTMQQKLNTAGIFTPEELRALGSEAAFLKMKAAYPEVCFVHLYTLEGAIRGVAMEQLPADVKKRLKAFSDSL